VTTTVYRITKSRYRDQAFSGLGGIHAYGRWTPRGIPVVYTSLSISLAVLEYTLNYKRHGWLPVSVLARANIPDEVGVESTSTSELPDNWRDPDPPAALREIGEDWLRRAETACLRVPSAIVPDESNYLLNPRHPDFNKLTIGPVEPFNFDRRLGRARRHS
jgi:RES domain-containing protein